MRYCSTRGGVNGVTFEDALYTGYAEDGGILLPEKIPFITKETLASWAKLSYVDIVKKIVPYFVGEDEVPHGDLIGKIMHYFIVSCSPRRSNIYVNTFLHTNIIYCEYLDLRSYLNIERLSDWMSSQYE